MYAITTSSNTVQTNTEGWNENEININYDRFNAYFTGVCGVQRYEFECERESYKRQ